MQKKGLSTQVVALIVILAVVLSGAAVAVAMILRPPPPEIVVLPDPAPRTGVQVITEENIVDILDDMVQRADRSTFTTHMNTTWRFPNGRSASSNAVMGNSSANTYPFYFTVELADTGEVVFTSGLLPVGSRINRIVLDTNLAQGTYAAVVVINMVDENGQAVESNVGINITLIIER
jgi:hypothetical protein